MTTTIRYADLVDSVAAALQYISYYHPADYIEHLARAYASEQSPAAKDAIAQILTNSKMCAEGHRPICQDTGIVNVFLKIGMDVRWGGFTGSIADAVNEGVRRAVVEAARTPGGAGGSGGASSRGHRARGQGPGLVARCLHAAHPRRAPRARSSRPAGGAGGHRPVLRRQVRPRG